MPLTDDQIVSEWIIKTGDSVRSVDELSRKLRAEERHEKSRQKVLQALNGDTKSLSKATADLAGSYSLAFVKGSLYMTVLGGIKDTLRDTIKEGLDYEDWIGNATSSLSGMADASARLLSNLDMMRAKTRLTTGDLQANESQLNAVTKAAVAYTRVVKTDFKTSLDLITSSIVRGDTGALKEIGIQIDLAGTAAEKSAKALELIESRFGSMNVKAENTNEKIEQLGNAWKNFKGQVGAAVISTDAVQNSFNRAKAEMDLTRSAIGLFTTGMGQGTVEGRVYGKVILGIAENYRYWLDLLTGGTAGAAIDRMREMVDISAAWAASGLSDKAQAAVRGGGGGGGAVGISSIATLTADQEKKRAAASGKKETGGKVLQFRPHDPFDTPAFPVQKKPKREKELFGYEEILQPLPPLIDRTSEAVQRTAESFHDLNKHIHEAVAALFAGADAASGWRAGLAAATEYAAGAGVKALGDFTAGLWAAADAAIMGSDTIGMAIAKTLKTTLLGIAQEASVKAIMATAEFLITKEPSYLVAAGLYAGVAAVAGGAGLGLSYGIKAEGGYDTGQQKTGAGSISGPGRHTFGKKVENNQPIYISVYLSDSGSALAGEIAARKLETRTQLKMAA